VKPDTLSVRVVNEAELDADSADLTVVIEGTAVFSGGEAFKKAVELRTLLDSLQDLGIEEKRVKLRSVEINSQSFALIKSSSARYVISIKTVTLESLPSALGVIAAHKGAKLTRLVWNYSQLKQTRSRLRQEAIEEALAQARQDASALGVTILGVHHLTEESRGKDHNSEYIAGDSASLAAIRRKSSNEPMGFQLGNSTTVTVDLRAEFRVSALVDQQDPP
jgi:uncharacterized protein YggE